MLRLNGEKVIPTIFPDKTSQIWKLPESTFSSNKQEIFWQFENESEIMHLLQLQHLLITKNHNVETTLTIKYMPYGRQDKNVSNNVTFALHTFWKVIRDFNFHKIVVYDPHNFDAMRPHCQFKAIYPIEEVERTVELVKADMLCYPDGGAVTKYSKIYDFKYACGEKVRDQLTGNITSYKLYGNVLGKNILIVDDICDGGMTFILLAKDLLAAGATEVNLFVTHGIFSKGLGVLKKSGIKRIFTQDGECED